MIDIENLKSGIIKEMWSHFLKRKNTLVFTKNIEDLWNSLSGYSAPAGAAFGRRRDLDSLLFDLPAGKSAKIWWDLPKFTDSVFMSVYLECPRYRRIKLINTDTGDYYEIEAYPPAVSNDNRIYKYVSGVKSSNINVISGMDLSIGTLFILSWDSRSFTDTLWTYISFVSYAYGAFESRSFVMRDKDITQINRIEIEWENDDVATHYGEIGIILSPLYCPLIITYR